MFTFKSFGLEGRQFKPTADKTNHNLAASVCKNFIFLDSHQNINENQALSFIDFVKWKDTSELHGFTFKSCVLVLSSSH